MDERWARATEAAVNVLYAVALAVLVLGAMPGFRLATGRWWDRQVHAWRYGRWLGSRTTPPRWTALLERDDLPQERTP